MTETRSSCNIRINPTLPGDKSRATYVPYLLQRVSRFSEKKKSMVYTTPLLLNLWIAREWERSLLISRNVRKGFLILLLRMETNLRIFHLLEKRWGCPHRYLCDAKSMHSRTGEIQDHSPLGRFKDGKNKGPAESSAHFSVRITLIRPDPEHPDHCRHRFFQTHTPFKIFHTRKWKYRFRPKIISMTHKRSTPGQIAFENIVLIKKNNSCKKSLQVVAVKSQRQVWPFAKSLGRNCD